MRTLILLIALIISTNANAQNFVCQKFVEDSKFFQPDEDLMDLSEKAKENYPLSKDGYIFHSYEIKTKDDTEIDKEIAKTTIDETLKALGKAVEYTSNDNIFEGKAKSLLVNSGNIGKRVIIGGYIDFKLVIDKTRITVKTRLTQYATLRGATWGSNEAGGKDISSVYPYVIDSKDKKQYAEAYITAHRKSLLIVEKLIKGLNSNYSSDSDW